MKKQIHERLLKALEEDDSVEPKQALLDVLRALSADESQYLDLPPDERKALTTWFDEMKDLFMGELLQGNFGSQILLDTFFVLCFEVGYKLAKNSDE